MRALASFVTASIFMIAATSCTQRQGGEPAAPVEPTPDFSGMYLSAAGWTQPEVYPFNAAGEALAQGYDRLEDVNQLGCDPGSLFRGLLNGTPEYMDPLRITQEGGVITIKYERSEVLRTIHMDRAAAAESPPRTRLGYSTGHWEDRTLVVETKRISWPYFDSIGTPQSDALEIVERFTVSEDGRRLDLHMTITDSATFTETATFEAYRLALGETLIPYDCQVH